MFEISWSEILVIGVVALIVVGPKELPVLLRTVGRYMGIIKRQAAEFRAQFDEAMRESEFDQIRKDVESIKTDAENTMRDAERSVHNEMADARREFDATTDSMKLDHKPAEAVAEHDQTSSVSGPDVSSHDISTSLPMPDEAASHQLGETPPELTPAGSAAVAAAAAAASVASPVAHEPAAHEPPAHDPPAQKPGTPAPTSREPEKTGV